MDRLERAVGAAPRVVHRLGDVRDEQPAAGAARELRVERQAGRAVPPPEDARDLCEVEAAAPWMGFLLLGWAVGLRLARPDPDRASPVAGALLAGRRDARPRLAGARRDRGGHFLVVRGHNGYGNAHLLRRDGS